MRSGGGKAKGSAFEREICKRLSLWVSNGKKLDLFWRSAMSGGRATVAARKCVSLSRQAGDITAVAPEGHSLTDRYYIECKHVRSIDLEAFIVHRKGKLAGFWAVACREAKAHQRRPMIIARQNRMPTLVVTAGPPPVGVMISRVLVKGSWPLATKPGDWQLHLFDDMTGRPYAI